MPQMYYDARTNELTTKQYSQDPRTGTLLVNRTAPLGAIAQQTGQTAVTQVQGAGGQQVRVQEIQLAALRGEYGYEAMREAQLQVGQAQGRSVGRNTTSQSGAGNLQSEKDSRTVDGMPIGLLRTELDKRAAQIAAEGPGAPTTSYRNPPERPEQPSQRYYTVLGVGRDPASAIVAAAEKKNTVALDYYDPIDRRTGLVKNYYIPEGNFMQQQLQNIKLGQSESGELAFYEKMGRNEAGFQRMSINPDTGAMEPFILFGGAGRNAAQSGMFGYVAGTPAVFGRGEVQRGREGLVSPYVMAPILADSGMSGIEVFNIVEGGNAGQYDTRDFLSRLGAEAYGGVVQFTDARTLGNIRYEDVGNRAEWNMARYADPQAVNRGKADLPGARIPWSVGEGTPAVFFMDQFTRSGDTAKAAKTPGVIAAYYPSRGTVWLNGDVTGLGKRTSEPNITLTGRSISYGDIKAYPEAEGLGRVRGSKMVAGVPVVVAEGSHASEFAALAKRCNNINQSMINPSGSGMIGSSASVVASTKAPSSVWDLTPENSGLSSSRISMLQWGAKQGQEMANSFFKEPKRNISIGKSPQSAIEGLPKDAEASFSTASLVSPIRLTSGIGPMNMKEDIGMIFGAASKGDIWRTLEGTNQLIVKNTPLGYFPDFSTVHPDTLSNAASIASAPATGGLSLLPQFKGNNLFVGSFVQGAYEYSRTKPIESLALFGTGRVFAGIVSYAPKAVAVAATSNVPVVGTIGMAASTPLARDFGRVGMTALGVYVVGSAGLNIYNQPTTEGKGRVAGETIAQFGAFGLGMVNVGSPEYINPFESREFFSGKINMGPVERVTYRIKTKMFEWTLPTSEQREMARSISIIGGSTARFQEPPVKGEPIFEDALSLGKTYGPTIRKVASNVENPSITKGSMVTSSQYNYNIWLRQAKDWDAFTYDVGEKFGEISTESKISNIPKSKQFKTPEDVMASGIADIRPIPQGYPGFKSSIAPDVRPEETVPRTWFDTIFGNPFEPIIGPRGTPEQLLAGRTIGYTGLTSAEAAQAQFGRKVGSALADFTRDPIGQGFRVQKDLYDAVSIYETQYDAARLQFGVDVTKGDWKIVDASIRNMLNIEMRIGSEKGQTAGGKIVRLGDLYSETLMDVWWKKFDPGYKDFTKDFEPYLPNSITRNGIVPSALSSVRNTAGGIFSISFAKGSGSPSMLSPSMGSITMLSPSMLSPSMGSPSIGSPSSMKLTTVSKSIISDPVKSFSTKLGSSKYLDSIKGPSGSSSSKSPSLSPLSPSPSPYKPSPSTPYKPESTPYTPPSDTPSTPIDNPFFNGGGSQPFGGGKRYKRQIELFSFDLASPSNMANPFAMPSGGKKGKKNNNPFGI